MSTSSTNSTGDLEQRLLRVEAWQQLTTLVSRYCTATDDRDYPALEGMFTEDARFNDHQGRAAILAFFRQAHAKMGPCYHYSHAPTIELESNDAATGVINSHAEISFKDGPVWMGLRYIDRYVRIGGRWYIKSRDNKVRYAMSLTDLPAHYTGTLRKRLPGTTPQAGDIPDTVATYLASERAKGS